MSGKVGLILYLAVSPALAEDSCYQNFTRNNAYFRNGVQIKLVTLCQTLSEKNKPDPCPGRNKVACHIKLAAKECPKIKAMDRPDFLPWLYSQPDRFELLKAVMSGTLEELTCVRDRYRRDHKETEV